MSTASKSQTAHYHSPAQRAHTRRVAWAMLAYGVILPPLVWYAGHHALARLTATAMAIAASVPLLVVFGSWARYLSQEKDEYLRSLVTGRMIVATNVTMVVAVSWGFLQAFDAMALVPVYWIPVVWVVAQGFAALFAREKAENSTEIQGDS